MRFRSMQRAKFAIGRLSTHVIDKVRSRLQYGVSADATP